MQRSVLHLDQSSGSSSSSSSSSSILQLMQKKGKDFRGDIHVDIRGMSQSCPAASASIDQGTERTYDPSSANWCTSLYALKTYNDNADNADTEITLLLAETHKAFYNGQYKRAIEGFKALLGARTGAEAGEIDSDSDPSIIFGFCHSKHQVRHA